MLLSESRKFTGDNFVQRWLPIIFHRVLAKDPVWLSVLNCEPDGKLLMDIMGCDQDGSLLLCKLKQQADEFPITAFQMLFKVNTIFNPYLNSNYNFLIMSFCVTSLQRMLEDGHASDDLFDIFCRRNSSLLRAMGAQPALANSMGRFLACKAFYAYSRDQWAKAISPLEMLGPETYELDSMINFREDHAWMVSPLADPRWNTQSVEAFIQELATVEMDSRRLFTSGMDYLIENRKDPLVQTRAGFATQLIVDELADGKQIDLGETYVINLLKHAQGPAQELCIRVIDYVLSNENGEYHAPSMLKWVKGMSGDSLFQRSAIEVMLNATEEAPLSDLIPLVDKTESVIAQVNSSLRRIFVEDELGM